jgi:two-component system, LytTR family, sensor kinase
MTLKGFIYRFRIYHFLFWLLLFAGWHFFRYQDYPSTSAWLITTIKVVDLAILVYITNYILIPRILYKKRYVSFVVVLLLMIVTSSVIKMYWIGHLLSPATPLNIFDHFKVRIYDNVFPHILLVSTGIAFKLLLDNRRAQKRLIEMAKEKAETELQYLKSQINPHLLFNSLNSIYFLIDKQNQEARQTLIQFSDLLRYQLYDCNANTIEIEKEVRYLRDYVRLQQLRKDKQYNIQLNEEGEMKAFRITPLLLVPFVENAFKHLSHHNDKRNFVEIELSRQNGTFQFTVVNSTDKHRSTEPRGGIGLANVQRRLELLYPGKHQLQIIHNEDTFRVHLELAIDNQ